MIILIRRRFSHSPPLENSKEDFEFKFINNIKGFNEETPVCFRLCIENVSEGDLLKLFDKNNIPACRAADSKVSADKWCISERKHFVGPDPSKRMDCSYVEVNTPLMKVKDVPQELWLAIQKFNSIGGYQRGLILPIVTDQIVTDFCSEPLYKTGEERFLRIIEDTEKLYPGFKEKLQSASSFSEVPGKEGLLYHGGRIYDSPYKVVSTAPKSCIYATPNSKMASGFATSDFGSSLIQGIVHAYKQTNFSRFYTDWGIEEYKPLINNLSQAVISREQAMETTSESPVFATNEMAEIWLRIKDRGFIKVDPKQEDIKYFLNSVKTYERDPTFLAHRIALKQNPEESYHHFMSSEGNGETPNKNLKDKISNLRGIKIQEAPRPVRKTTLNLSVAKQNLSQHR